MSDDQRLKGGDFRKQNTPQGDLAQRFKSGMTWFYWIAGLSVLNSLFFWGGGNLSFLFGLSMSRIVDQSFAAMFLQAGGESGRSLPLVGIVLAVLVAAPFALFGFLSQRGNQTAYFMGITLYVIDGFFAGLQSAWLSLGFHLFALLGLLGGFQAMRDLSEVDGEEGGVGEANLLDRPNDPRRMMKIVGAILLVILAGYLINLLRGG